MILYGLEVNGTEHYVSVVSIKSTESAVNANTDWNRAPLVWPKKQFVTIQVCADNDIKARALHQTI